jgi:hypothetical protein
MNPDFYAISFNCTSIRNSKDQLEKLLEKVGNCLGNRPRAVLLQETFLTKEEMLKLKIRGYRPIVATDQNDTDNKGRRGSVILVDHFLNVQILKERSVKVKAKGKTKKIEMIGVKVLGDTEKTYQNPFELWTVYSGPYTEEEPKLNNLLKTLSKERKNRVLLMGDLNSNLSFTNSESLNNQTRGKKTRKTLEEMQDEGEVHILNEYSKRTTAQGTTIDIAITMGNWREGFAYPIEEEISSTHFAICVGVDTQEQRPKRNKNEDINIPKYKRTKETEKKIKGQCRTINENIENYNARTLAQAIADAFEDNARDPAPRKERKTHKHWWNEEIQNLYNEKQKHLGKKGKDEEFKRLDKQLQEEITKAKNKSFQEYVTTLDHRNKNKEVYKAMRTIGARQSPATAELTIKGKDGKIVTSSKEKANMLSKRYQVPLGYHPKRDPIRKARLRRTRKEQEKNNPKGMNHTPFTASDARIAREDMAKNKAPDHPASGKRTLRPAEMKWMP